MRRRAGAQRAPTDGKLIRNDARAGRSWTLSGELWDITSKFDGKGENPVKQANMDQLAEYIAYIKELPSQVHVHGPAPPLPLPLPARAPVRA